MKCATCDPLLAPGLCPHTEGEYAQPVEHQHVWAKDGCWCGAKKCTYLGDLRTVDAQGTVMGACQKAAEFGRFCFDHQPKMVCSNCRSENCDGTRCV